MNRDDPVTGGGVLVFLLGVMAFVSPLLGRELLIFAWLDDMMQPVGLSAMVVGGILVAIGKLRQFRNSSPVTSPTDPSHGVSQSATADAKPPVDQSSES